MQCPCGSCNSYEQCCFLLISQKTFAQSPEKLMRSRYSAYAKNAAEYIYHTYAKSSQVQQSVTDIESWAEQTTWLKLLIHSASDVSLTNKTSPTVCFSAYYQHQGLYYLMKETSQFFLEHGEWRYLDGEVSESEKPDLSNLPIPPELRR